MKTIQARPTYIELNERVLREDRRVVDHHVSLAVNRQRRRVHRQIVQPDATSWGVRLCGLGCHTVHVTLPSLEEDINVVSGFVYQNFIT